MRAQRGLRRARHPSVAYTDPEVAWAGLTENEAKAQGSSTARACSRGRPRGARCRSGAREGITKLLFDEASERVIGCGIVGPNAGDLIAEPRSPSRWARMRPTSVTRSTPHPTLSETVAMAAEMFEGTITDLMPPKRKATG